MAPARAGSAVIPILRTPASARVVVVVGWVCLKGGGTSGLGSVAPARAGAAAVPFLGIQASARVGWGGGGVKGGRGRALNGAARADLDWLPPAPASARVVCVCVCGGDVPFEGRRERAWIGSRPPSIMGWGGGGVGREGTCLKQGGASGLGLAPARAGSAPVPALQTSASARGGEGEGGRERERERERERKR